MVIILDKFLFLFVKVIFSKFRFFSTSESIKSSALPFEGINYIKRGDSLSFCMLNVGDRISNDILMEGFKRHSCFIIDQRTDSLNSTSAGEFSDGRFGDSHDDLTNLFVGHFLSSLLSHEFTELSFSSLSLVS